jgi:hypothetical protein
VLLSTWSLKSVKPKKLQEIFGNKFHFGQKEWKKIMSDLEELRSDESIDEVFKFLIWSDGESIEFDKITPKVLFLHGLEDELFSRQLVKQNNDKILRKIKNCTFISIPSKHVILKERELVAGLVSEFILN